MDPGAELKHRYCTRREGSSNPSIRIVASASTVAARSAANVSVFTALIVG